MSASLWRPGWLQNTDRYQQGGSVRAARERIEQKPQSEQHTGPIYPPNHPLISQYSTARSPPLPPLSPTSVYSVATDKSEPQSNWHLPKVPPVPQLYKQYGQPFNIYQQPNTNINARNFPQSIPTSHPNQNNPYTITNDERTTSARSSTGSEMSFTSLSEFANAPQRAPSLKRGITSYYSQYTNVSPIIEESEGRTSIRSYASSNVIPTNVGNFFYDEGETPSDDEDVTDEDKLVRQASVGKRGRPSLTSISSSGSRKKFVKQVIEGRGPARLASPPPALTSTSQVELDKYLRELESDRATSEFTTLKQVKRGTLADRIGAKVPPRLAMVKEENRTSTTSLPDLIRRATKLASNLDKGRTASRIGTDWFVKDGDPEKEGMTDYNRPRKISPGGHSVSNLGSRRDDHSGGPILTPKENFSKTYETRLCGMSRKSFIGLMVLLIILISAAIIIPIALVVIPKHSHVAHAATNTTAGCSSSCQNGGINQTVDNSCVCLCLNGFSGPTCSSLTQAACANTPVATLGNATVGAQILPLLDSANNDFSIPLNPTLVLGQFAKYNLTCAAENALITFPDIPSAASKMTFAETPAEKGLEIPNTVVETPIASSSIPTPEAPVVVDLAHNSSAIAFAKVAILFVLQDSHNVTIASLAQTKLVSALGSTGQVNSTAIQNVDLGNGYALNWWLETVMLKNGTIYGKRFNGTAIV
jgi:hypothetical protein